jgi:hypothetical protein
MVGLPIKMPPKNVYGYFVMLFSGEQEFVVYSRSGGTNEIQL